MKRAGMTDVARLAEGFARESGVDRALIVRVDVHNGFALAAVDCGNTTDSLNYGSVLCRHRPDGWVVVPEPVEWSRHGWTVSKDWVACLSVDFVDPDAAAVHLGDGTVLRPAVGRLFRIGWRGVNDVVPISQIEMTSGELVKPALPWTPVSLSYLLEMALDWYRRDFGVLDNDRLGQGADSYMEAQNRIDVLGGWLRWIEREDNDETRREISEGPLADCLARRLSHEDLASLTTTLQRSEQVRESLRSLDLSGLPARNVERVEQFLNPDPTRETDQ